MLDAIEEVCLFCAMCLMRVGRVIHGADDADSVTQHSSQIYYRWRPLPSAHLHMWPAPARAFHMRAHSQSKCCAHSKCRALSQRPHCASGQTCPRTVRRPVHFPTWRPHISSAIVGLGLLRGFLNKSTVRWLPLASFTHFTVVLQNLQGASTYRSNLSMLASTKNSYIGCAASSCSASPDGGLHLWRSNSVVPTQCRHSPQGIFEWCRARVSGSSSQSPPETQSLGLPALPIRQHEALEHWYKLILAPEFATFRAASHSCSHADSVSSIQEAQSRVLGTIVSTLTPNRMLAILLPQR